MLLFLKKILITFVLILTLFLFFFCRKILICLGPFFAFLSFFFFRKIFIFHVLLFEAFLCAFYNSYLSFLYVKIFFIRIFFIRIFSVRIRRNFYVISNILQCFFLQQDIYILLQKLENNSFYLF